jgi:hypothetical protein
LLAALLENRGHVLSLTRSCPYGQDALGALVFDEDPARIAAGGQNLLGRSEDHEVRLDDGPAEVKALLRARYRARRRDSSLEGPRDALRACSRRLTCGAPPTIASNAEGISQAARRIAGQP